MNLGSLGLGPRPAIILALVVLLVFVQLPTVVVGLRTTPGSPCEDVCHRGSTDTSPSEIVCLDREYNGTSKGSNFQECVDCQLKSDFEDSNSGESDVSWGLYNLRFAFSSCIYGLPEHISNISSPCVVSCSSMAPALGDDLSDPSSIDLFNWCDSQAFADVVVDQCEFCYNLTTTQAYLANCAFCLDFHSSTHVCSELIFMKTTVLEALRYNCHFRTPSGTAFPITPSRIFTQSQLPSSSRSLISPNQESGTQKHLAVIIAVPIVVFVVIVCSLGVCCFFFIRHRRRKVRKQRGSQHLHARWNDTTISTPPAWAQYHMQPGMGMGMGHGMQDPVMSPAGYGYGGHGYGPGVGFMDNDGREQDVGYAKSGMTGVAQPWVAVASHQEQEKSGEGQQQQQPYFPPPPPPPGVVKPKNSS